MCGRRSVGDGGSRAAGIVRASRAASVGGRSTFVIVSDDEIEPLKPRPLTRARKCDVEAERKPLVIDVSKVKPSKEANLFSLLDDTETN